MRVPLATALLTIIGCTGAAEKNSIGAEQENSTTQPSLDSTAARDTTVSVARPAREQPAAKKRVRDSSQLRDSAVEPVMEVGPDGKLRPIKRN